MNGFFWYDIKGVEEMEEIKDKLDMYREYLELNESRQHIKNLIKMDRKDRI